MKCVSDRDNFNADTDVSGNRKEKFISFLKRAFSTDEFDESYDDNVNEPVADDVYNDDNANSSQTQYDDRALPKSPIAVQKPAPVVSEIPDIDNSSDPAEDEELLMIDAFFKGEEYEFPKSPKDSGFDAQNAYEEEDAVFVFDDDDIDFSDAETQEKITEEIIEETPEETGETENEESEAPASDNDTGNAADSGDGEEEAAESASVDGAAEDENTANSGEAETAESIPSYEIAAGEEDIGEDVVFIEEEIISDDTLDQPQQAENTDAAQDPADKNDNGGDAPATEELTGELNEDDDDEEFVVEEDFLFDESEEDPPHLQSDDEFSDISHILSTDSPGNSENAADDEISEGDAAEETVIDTAENVENDDDTEKVQDEVTADAPAEAITQTENSIPNVGDTADNVIDFQPVSSTNTENKGGFFKNAKDKIIEIWNTKVDEADARETSEAQAAADTDYVYSADAAAAATGTAQEKKISVGDIAQKAKAGIAKLTARFKNGGKQTPAAEATSGDEWVYSEENLFTDVPPAEPISVAVKSVDDTETKPEEDIKNNVNESEVIAESDDTSGSDETADSVETAETMNEKSDELAADDIKNDVANVEESAVDESVEILDNVSVDETAESSEEKLEEKIPEEKISDEKTSDEESGEIVEGKIEKMTVISGNRRANDDEYDKEELRKKLNVVKADIYTPEQRKLREDSRNEYTARVRELEERLKSMEIPPAEKSERVPSVSEFSVDDYRPVLPDVIKFPEGSFRESVRFEYECIVNYRKMRSVSTREALVKDEPEPEQSPLPDDIPAQPIQTAEQTSAFALPDIGEFDETAAFARSHDTVESIGKRLDDMDEKSPEPIEYRTEEDALEVRKYLSANRSSAMLTFGATAALTTAAFLVSCFASSFSVGAGAASIDASQRMFVLVNILLFGGSIYFCRDMLMNGLLPLKKFKSNSDTGVAAAAAAAALQLLFALIVPRPFMGQGLNLYTVLVMLAMTVSCAGNYFNCERISANFRFVSDDSQKYAGKFFHDQRMVVRLLSGTKNDKTELTFQKKTAFLKHFIKLSNEPDPGEKLSKSFAIPVIVISLVAAVGTLLFSHSFYDAISVMCIMLCIGIPMSARVLASFPLYKLSKRVLLGKSMVVGYKAVETFAESAAVMIDARDLYPEGSVQLNDIKVLDTYRWQEAVYSAAALATEAGSAMAGIFGTVIEKNRSNSVKVESFVYEDGKGLVGWVNNEQICVGNRELLISHGISVLSTDEEDSYRENGDELLYITSSGRLVGFLLVGYTANLRVSDVLKRMEASEMSLLVRTTDVNITAEKIAKDFGIGYKSIKILEQKNSNVIRDEMVGRERSSPAFVATKGGVTSFGLAISECIQAKRSITLSEAIEIVGALLKLLVVSAIVMFSGIHHVGAVALFVISLLWCAAVIASPSIAQHFNREH